MESDDDSEIDGITCCTDPTKNCECTETGFDSYSSDDSLRELSIKRRRPKSHKKKRVPDKSIVAALKCFKKKPRLSVWRRIDRSRSCSLSSCEGVSVSISTGFVQEVIKLCLSSVFSNAYKHQNPVFRNH